MVKYDEKEREIGRKGVEVYEVAALFASWCVTFLVMGLLLTVRSF